MVADAGSSASEPVVSVVIPCYNAASTLGDQLEALAGQVDAPPFEVIVADNGSTDGSSAIVARFAKRMPVRQVLADGTRGANVARNSAVRTTSTPIVLFCDSDDVVGPSWVATLSTALSTGADLVGGPIDYRQLNDREQISWRGATSAPPSLVLGFLPSAHLANCGVRRHFFDSVGGLDEDYEGGDDVDFCWRVQLAGGTFLEVADAVVHYRLRDELRSLWRQAIVYGAAEPHLFRDFRDEGLRRRPARSVLHSIWWLVSRAPFSLADRGRRGAWLRVMGTQLGRVVGSVRWRVLYL